MNKTNITASIAAILVLGVILAQNLTSSVQAGNEGTCSDADGWIKIDSGDLSLYPVDGASQYCFKAGPSLTYTMPSEGFDQDGACTTDNIERCELSHWSYYISEVVPSSTPTPTPTSSPSESSQPSSTPTPTSEPSDNPSDNTNNESGDSYTTSEESGEVLGSMAATGVVEDVIMNMLGSIGGIMTGIGSVMYGKKSSIIQ